MRLISLKDEKGMAAVIALSILIILLALGSVILFTADTEFNIAGYQKESTQALYIADAGIQYVTWYLFNVDSGFRGTLSQVLGEGVFTGEVTDTADGVNIKVTGYVPDAANPRAKRIVDGFGASPPYHPIYDYALYSHQALTCDWDTGTNLIETFRDDNFGWAGQERGDAHANGDIIFMNDRNRKMDGKVSSTGTVIRDASWSGANPWRTKEDGVDIITPPLLDDDARQWYEDNADRVFTGNQTVTGTFRLYNDMWYLKNGDLTIYNATMRDYGTFVVDGDVYITGWIRYYVGGGWGGSENGPFAIVCFGNIYYNPSGDPTDDIDAALYANNQFIVPSQKTIEINGNLGSQNGFNMAANTGVLITFDSRLKRDLPAGSLPAIPALYDWLELY